MAIRLTDLDVKKYSRYATKLGANYEYGPAKNNLELNLYALLVLVQDIKCSFYRFCKFLSEYKFEGA